MNRIDERFARLKERQQKGLVIYIGAGDPDLDATRRLALAFDRNGVDVLELGVPFSDPLADGLVNQLAAQRGLESGTTPSKVLDAVADIRKESQIPIVLYIYYNLVYRHGVEQFVREAARAGVDGLLVLDLPPEESELYEKRMREHNLRNIYLVAPTTPADRMALIARRATGFVYCVSREGVTGMQSQVSDRVAELTGLIRGFTDLPIAVGFGISNPAQARQVAATADAVVVGSAVVSRIAELKEDPGMVDKVAAFVHSLSAAIKGDGIDSGVGTTDRNG